MLPINTVTTPPEGEHRGLITKITHRTTDGGYEYTDVEVDLSDVEGSRLRVSVPTTISKDESGKPRSKLAILLTNLGISLDAEELDEQSILGTKVKFYSTVKETDKGQFGEISLETLKKV